MMSGANHIARGIPALILGQDGQVAATKAGPLPKGRLNEWVESVL
ncbi:MAG: hypothetical protein V3U93_03165 [Alphaproteobacteria bacterium]